MKIDNIGEIYYQPLAQISKYSDRLFCITATLSIGVLLIDKAANPKLYDLLQILFAIGVILGFGAGLAVRLYWAPRAEDKRRQDLLSNAFDVPLVHNQPSGYYNNDQTNSIKRLAAALLENSLFSKTIARHMLKAVRIRTGVYVIVWLVALMNRSTDLGLIATVAQAVFSEQIISQWLRLEWLRMRFERVYENIYQLIQTTTSYNRDEFRARVVESFGYYETGKAYGGIILSENIFKRMNPTLSQEWERTRALLKL